MADSGDPEIAGSGRERDSEQGVRGRRVEISCRDGACPVSAAGDAASRVSTEIQSRPPARGLNLAPGGGINSVGGAGNRKVRPPSSCYENCVGRVRWGGRL